MKKILFTLLLFVGSLSAVQAQEIRWMSLDDALLAQKRVAKPIFMDVYTDWCGPCKMLDKNTFQSPDVAAYVNANYYAVKFNAEGNSEVNYKGQKYKNPNFDPKRTGRNSVHEFTMLLRVQGYPSMFIIDSKGELKEPIVGYRTPEQLLPLIKV